MRKLLFVVAALVTGIGAGLEWWRRHPRFGSDTVNRVVNPWLIRQGVPDTSQGEIGLLEHVGRQSGAIRVTPIHPVPTSDGLRIIVPLGGESQWARNVLAAGHCRVQIGDSIHELDEPRLVSASEVEGLPPAAARFMDWLGFRYLLLHRFAEQPGELILPAAKASGREAIAVDVGPVEPAGEPAPELVPTA